MSCPVCGLDDPGDPSVGYHGADVCQTCLEAGWDTASDGTLIEPDACLVCNRHITLVAPHWPYCDDPQCLIEADQVGEYDHE